MTQQNDIHHYIRSLFVKEDDVLEAVFSSISETGMPHISVPGETGKLLYLLAKLTGAKRILEIGALGGYSSIWLARALPADGRLLSLELKPSYANVAKTNVERAGLEEKVNYRIGPALESLEALDREGRTFDFFFIDADKKNYPNYLQMAIKLAVPGALITADNVLWRGKVANPADEDHRTEYMRQFNEMAAQHPRLESIVIPVGDGLFMGRVKS